MRTRAFLVGCPRSGTTLLQRLLASHSQVTSFPETHFFAEVASRQRGAWRLELASRRARSRTLELLKTVAAQDLASDYPLWPVTMDRACASFIRILDTLADRSGKSVWIEKTPRHLHFIQRIESAVPDARFIHILRNGAEVALSLMETSQKHPELWDGARTLEACIDRWNRDLRITARMVQRSNHHLVRYEHLVANPTQTLAEAFRFLNLDPEQMEAAPSNTHLVREDEPWKRRALEPIRQDRSRYAAADAETREVLDRMLLPIDAFLAPRR